MLFREVNSFFLIDLHTKAEMVQYQALRPHNYITVNIDHKVCRALRVLFLSFSMLILWIFLLVFVNFESFKI